MEYGKDLEKLQKIELKILREIDALCKEKNIEYFIIGGTCLGAKRHGGFIPWDDDIDIGMTRENYERFLKEAKKLKEPLFLQCFETEKTTPYPYAKVRYEGTKFVEYPNRKIKMHDGVYVDVFPFDNVPDNDEEYRKTFDSFRKLIMLNAIRCSPDVSTKPTGTRRHIVAVAWKFLHAVFCLIPKKVFLSKLEKAMTRYNSVETKAMACWFFPKRYTEYGTKETLFPLRECDFNGIKVPCPNDLDTYLKNHYGNYMQLPPLEQRVGHRPYIFDIDNVILEE